MVSFVYVHFSSLSPSKVKSSIKNTFKSKIAEFKLDNDLYLAHIDNFTSLTDTITKGIDKRFIQFYYCTKGNLTFNFNNGNYKINLLDGSNLLLFNPTMALPLNLSISANSKVCIVVVSIEKLHKLFSENNIENTFLRESSSNKYYKQQDFSAAARMVISQIESNQLSSHFKNLYLLGKVYELFTLYFSEAEEPQHETCPFLDNKEDAKSLKNAKSILLENLTNPPILKDLAEQSGLSEYKLKEGFKQVYGTTVYGFVMDKKMEIAREKLSTNKIKIKDLAFEMGYENPSHFIAAFKKKFGVTPKQFSKEK